MPLTSHILGVRVEFSYKVVSTNALHAPAPGIFDVRTALPIASIPEPSPF